MDQKIIVALDAMGGDLAPMETVKGAVDAVKEMNVLVKLVGREEDVKRELAKYTYPKEKIEVVHAEEVISTDEVPTMAIRKKEKFLYGRRYAAGEKWGGRRLCFRRQYWCPPDRLSAHCRSSAGRRTSCIGYLPAYQEWLYILSRQRRKCGL